MQPNKARADERGRTAIGRKASDLVRAGAKRLHGRWFPLALALTGLGPPALPWRTQVAKEVSRRLQEIPLTSTKLYFLKLLNRYIIDVS